MRTTYIVILGDAQLLSLEFDSQWRNSRRRALRNPSTLFDYYYPAE